MNYSIQGGSFPVAICNLAQGEQVICEGGAMSWMSPNMQMATSAKGGFGKSIGRMFAGESLFLNTYTAQGGDGLIAFAAHAPGEIRAIEMTPGTDIVVQKRAFLAATPGVGLSVFFQKKLGAGLFGGEGFIMQRLSGQGLAFVEIDGATIEYELGPGQQLVLDTGYVAMMDATCSMDIQAVPGLKNKFLGGEGLFNTVVTGPGRVTVQTLPISALAGAVAPYVVTSK